MNSGNGLNATGGEKPDWVASDDINIAPTNDNLSNCGLYPMWMSAYAMGAW